MYDIQLPWIDDIILPNSYSERELEAKGRRRCVAVGRQLREG